MVEQPQLAILRAQTPCVPPLRRLPLVYVKSHVIDKHQLIGAVFGVIDSSVPFTYAIGLDPETYYIATLCVKLAIVWVYSEIPSQFEYRNILPLIVIAVGLLSALLQRDVSYVTILGIIGFVTHLFITGSVIRSSALSAYGMAISAVGALVLALYYFQWLDGQIIEVYGRYTFFGGSHPNLGGEIIAGIVFVSGFALRRRMFLTLSFFALAPLYLMQARAAMLFIVVLQGLCIYFNFIRHRSLSAQIVIIISACGLLIMVLIIGGAGFVSDVFFVNDVDRGYDSNFSGRGDLWIFAWDAFVESPIFGKGLGYYDYIGSLGAHNLLLFILSEDGLIGILFVGWVLHGVLRFGVAKGRELVWFLPFFILATFNDRFVNLNPYPFLFYVLIWLRKDMLKVNCLYRKSNPGRASRARVVGGAASEKRLIGS